MNQVIAIVGPTGVGKTKLSIALAKELNAQIISCDSMQFYKGLDIGTAKIKDEEKQGIKHHLLDILDPSEEFSVADYQRVVRNKIEDLHNKNIIPILVGGSGLYITSVLYDYTFPGNKRDESITKSLQEESLEDLVKMLEKKAPKIAVETDLKNKRRVIRALEKNDEDREEQQNRLYYDHLKLIALDLDRETLYERINHRVDKMIEEGLEDEAYTLYMRNLDSPAVMAIGYKEFFQHFEGFATTEECIETIKRNSRRYAKRQLTWFRNKLNCHWIHVDVNHFDKTIQKALKYIKQ